VADHDSIFGPRGDRRAITADRADQASVAALGPAPAGSRCQAAAGSARLRVGLEAIHRSIGKARERSPAARGLSPKLISSPHPARPIRRVSPYQVRGGP